MNAHSVPGPTSMQLERWLARLLEYGTYVASAVIAAGLVFGLVPAGVHPQRALLAALAPLGMHLITAGIAILILLPALRVTLMLAAFVRNREYRFGFAAAFVLVVIALGFAAGMLSAKAGA